MLFARASECHSMAARGGAKENRARVGAAFTITTDNASRHVTSRETRRAVVALVELELFQLRDALAGEVAEFFLHDDLAAPNVLHLPEALADQRADLDRVA